MVSTDSIHLYAELLLNIKTVTFFANLRSEHNHETEAKISADGESIIVSHEGESAELKLPTKIVGHSTAHLTLPAQPSKNVTMRLSLEEREPGLLRFGDFSHFENGNPVPWNAPSLDDSSALTCHKCSNVIVPAGTIREWKDLPNENWAEMMDFWHCHKPNEPEKLDEHGAETASARKGYAAANKFIATQASGFIDALSFLCAPADCTGTKVVEGTNDKASLPNVLCTACESVVGSYDAEVQGNRILKWATAIQRGGAEERYDSQMWISAQLLGIIENTGVRKVIIRDQDDRGENSEALMLWIFTPDLCFSSSIHSDTREDPTRAMKVFWVPSDNPDHILATQSTSFEEVLLPREQFLALSTTLVSNASLLPESARRFQQWHVSLLQRFEDDKPATATASTNALYT